MTTVGSAYGEALYDLAKSENLSSEILSQISVLDESFRQEPDVLRLLQSPSLPKAERCQILDSSFQGNVHLYVLNFLKILTEKGYARHFSDCCRIFREHYNLDNNILPVTAVTAVSLSAAQTEALSKKLGAITGKRITLANRVEPGVLGGIRLDYDGKQMDDTVLHRLDAIRAVLKTEVL